MTMAQAARVAEHYRKQAMKDAAQGGKVFWVDSTNSDGSNAAGFGLTPERPFLTVDYAIGQCTANSGFVINAMPGHSETIAAAEGVDFDVAGITLNGLGYGNARPTFVCATSTGATFQIAAGNTSIRNCIFECDIDAQTAMLQIDAANVTIEGNEFRNQSGTQPAIFINVGDGVTANVCDGLQILGNRIYSPSAGANTGITITAVQDGVVIRGNHIEGDFAVAGISSGAAFTNALISDNYVSNANAGNFAIELTAAATGLLVNNRLYANAAATTLDPGSMKCVNNFASNTIDDPGQIIPSGTSDLSDIGDALFGSTGIGTWPASAAPANGVSIAEAIRWINDALQDSNGVVTWAAGAAPANGVSIAEGIRFISEALTDGAAFSQTVDPGGTARASVELVLADLGAMLAGSAGITTFPAAAAAANGVSLAEVVRYISEQQSNRYVTKSAVVLTNGLDLFTVTGTIRVIALYLVCATANDGTASTIQFNAVPTVGSTTTLSAASASIANAAAGATITLAGTALSTAALYAANGPNLIANPGTVLVPAGVIDLVVGTGSTTGTWSAHLVYEPLSAGASVAAA